MSKPAAQHPVDPRSTTVRDGVKRTFDLLSAAILGVLLSPVLLGLAIAVRAQSGSPVLYRQERLGRRGRHFTLLKFRTMLVGSADSGAQIFVGKGDSRITRIGAFLRRTSLDELPQLWNVVRGDMSLVGPRPPLTWHPHEYADYSDEQRLRFAVRPGITGLAQVTGRNATGWDERIVHDVAYVRSRSLRVDLRILAQTFGVAAKGGDLYRAPAGAGGNGDATTPTVSDEADKELD